MVTYKKGNLLESNCDIIVHQVNCKRVMGSGIAKQIRNKWPKVYEEYCDNIDYCYDNGVCRYSYDFLGMLSWTEIDSNRYVVNFYSQDNYMPRNKCHTDYVAFKNCCHMLKQFLKDDYLKEHGVIGFPYKIGCGFAGGDWPTVSKIIEEELSEYNVEIWEYEQQ